MRTVLTNLSIDNEPDYMIRIVDEEANEWYLTIGDRSTWKRASALCHARYYARRNPTHSVHVELKR